MTTNIHVDAEIIKNIIEKDETPTDEEIESFQLKRAIKKVKKREESENSHIHWKLREKIRDLKLEHWTEESKNGY